MRHFLMIILISLCFTDVHAVSWFEDTANPYYSFYQKYCIVTHLEVEEEPQFFDMFHTDIQADLQAGYDCHCF